MDLGLLYVVQDCNLRVKFHSAPGSAHHKDERTLVSLLLLLLMFLLLLLPPSNLRWGSRIKICFNVTISVQISF